MNIYTKRYKYRRLRKFSYCSIQINTLEHNNDNAQSGHLLKLLSQSQQILIPKIKTNKNKQKYFTDYHYQQNTSLNFIEIPRCRQKNVKQIRASYGPGKDFPVYKQKGIPFHAHLAIDTELPLRHKSPFKQAQQYFSIFSVSEVANSQFNIYL